MRYMTWCASATMAVTLAACVDQTNVVSRNLNNPDEIGTVSSRNLASSEQKFNVYLTGYSYWDNTPPGSAAIARPVVHRRAGGTGTYRDPLTIAVGHSIVGSNQTLDYPAGTRFYLPQLSKYAIVEDVCGDGARPQNGPCHSGRNGLPWLDIYVDGSRAGNVAASRCMNSLTGVHKIVMNPAPDYPVVVGALTESGCATL